MIPRQVHGHHAKDPALVFEPNRQRSVIAITASQGAFLANRPIHRHHGKVGGIQRGTSAAGKAPINQGATELRKDLAEASFSSALLRKRVSNLETFVQSSQ